MAFTTGGRWGPRRTRPSLRGQHQQEDIGDEECESWQPLDTPSLATSETDTNVSRVHTASAYGPVPSILLQEIQMPEPLWPMWSDLEADVWNPLRALYTRHPRHPLSRHFRQYEREEVLLGALTTEKNHRRLYQQTMDSLRAFTACRYPERTHGWTNSYHSDSWWLEDVEGVNLGVSWGRQAVTALRGGESVRRIMWLWWMHHDMEFGNWPHLWLEDHFNAISILGGRNDFHRSILRWCSLRVALYEEWFHRHEMFIALA